MFSRRVTVPDVVWTVPASPQPRPTEDPDLVGVDDAVLTGFAGGPLRTPVPPARWIQGAAYDRDGALVGVSQRRWTGDPSAPVAADPELIRVPSRGGRLEGTWLYVGHWHNHFGHFFLETLTNLWPEPDQTRLTGLVAHRRFRGKLPRAGRPDLAKAISLETWKEELLDLAGYGGLEHVVVNTGPTHVERLLVPSQPVVLKCWASPAAVALWRRVAGRVDPGPDERVFLSRRLFHESKKGNARRVRVSRDWEDQLERLFAGHGFRIVHPETLRLPEQLAVVRGAAVLAGSSGSALHLSAFAGQGTRVIEIGDDRSPHEPMPAQQMVDAACGNPTVFCEYGDLAAVGRVLESL